MSMTVYFNNSPNSSRYIFTNATINMAWNTISSLSPPPPPPTHSRARRLDQAKLSAAKTEFLQMEDMGIIRRTKSAWSSPLHMVPKADGKWRPCGDYMRLNASTDDDRYPLPHIQDFNNHLAGCKVFFQDKLDKAISSNSYGPIIHPKDSCCHPLWTLGVSQNAFWLEKCGTVISAPYGRHTP